MVKKTYGKYTVEELEKINKEIMQIKDRSKRMEKRKEIRETNLELGIALAQYSMSLLKEDGILNQILDNSEQ